MRCWVLLTALIVAACSSTTDTGTTSAPTADGQWKATLTGSFTPGGSGVMALTLTQTGTTIAGNGTFTDTADPPPAILTVTGSISGTTVTLTVQTQPQQYMGQTVDAGKAPLTFSGTLTATTINGTLTGENVSGLTANFTKQ